MRIAIIGAGAVGGYLAARLAAAGDHQVMLLARGRRAEAIRRDGLRLTGREELVARPEVVATLAGGGPFDLVVTAVKAFALVGIAGEIAAGLGHDAILLPALNGIPWWYGEGLAAGPLAGCTLASVDPGGLLARTVPPGCTVGCVLYVRAESRDPGVVAFHGGRGLVIGEPTGGTSDRLGLLAGVLGAAGVAAVPTADIRSAVWNKLFGNIGLNPLTALAGVTVAELLADAALRARLASVMEEAQAIARAAGAVPDMAVASRIAGMAQLGAFRTSTLQDVDAARPLEIAALLAAPLEVAGRLGVACPATAALHAEITDFARARGLLPQPARQG